MVKIISAAIAFLVITAGITYWLEKNSPSPKQETPQAILQTATSTYEESKLVHATSGYATSLSAHSVVGTVATGTLVDIYIYGPNNGNGRDVGMAASDTPSGLSSNTRPGNLVFSKMNVLVKNNEWDIDFPLPLSGDETHGWYFYQINVGHPYTGTSGSLTMNASNTNYNLLKIR